MNPIPWRNALANTIDQDKLLDYLIRTNRPEYVDYLDNLSPHADESMAIRVVMDSLSEDENRNPAEIVKDIMGEANVGHTDMPKLAPVADRKALGKIAYNTARYVPKHDFNDLPSDLQDEWCDIAEAAVHAALFLEPIVNREALGRAIHEEYKLRSPNAGAKPWHELTPAMREEHCADAEAVVRALHVSAAKRIQDQGEWARGTLSQAKPMDAHERKALGLIAFNAFYRVTGAATAAYDALPENDLEDEDQESWCRVGEAVRATQPTAAPEQMAIVAEAENAKAHNGGLTVEWLMKEIDGLVNNPEGSGEYWLYPANDEEGGWLCAGRRYPNLRTAMFFP